MYRFFAILRKEFRQFGRDRLLVALVIFVYTVDIAMCTMALTFDVKDLRVGVLDQDRTQVSARLLETVDSTEYFGVLKSVASRAELDRMLDGGAIDLAIVVPPDFTTRANEGTGPALQVLISGINSIVASAARGYIGTIAADFERGLLSRRLDALAGASLPEVRADIRVWYNPNLEFRQFMAVSMIVAAALMIGVITTAAGLVREKDSGTIEQLIVTPLRTEEIVAAKAVPPFVISLLLVIPSVLVAKLFGVPAAGSWSLFLLASAAALLAFMAMGVLIASVSTTLQQALLISFFVIFPVMFLSGTVVPIDSMPGPMQWMSTLSPSRYYMAVAAGTLLKGVGWHALWSEFLSLVALSAAFAALAWMRVNRAAGVIASR